ncbi:hypothetical protein HaLaN_26092 [Haematococcus lacustris]|uniref:Uncharacterized protein n=1 Tax=Haematococcus lacustris TaxID=44745 RepID=A0A6A0A5E0_HAELA|nr:hypothetical protein HaLaN_26092 [Haematococcus lacustris]
MIEKRLTGTTPSPRLKLAASPSTPPALAGTGKAYENWWQPARIQPTLGWARGRRARLGQRLVRRARLGWQLGWLLCPGQGRGRWARLGQRLGSQDRQGWQPDWQPCQRGGGWSYTGSRPRRGACFGQGSRMSACRSTQQRHFRGLGNQKGEYGRGNSLYAHIGKSKLIEKATARLNAHRVMAKKKRKGSAEEKKGPPKKLVSLASRQATTGAPGWLGHEQTSSTLPPPCESPHCLCPRIVPWPVTSEPALSHNWARARITSKLGKEPKRRKTRMNKLRNKGFQIERTVGTIPTVGINPQTVREINLVKQTHTLFKAVGRP